MNFSSLSSLVEVSTYGVNWFLYLPTTRSTAGLPMFRISMRTKSERTGQLCGGREAADVVGGKKEKEWSECDLLYTPFHFSEFFF